MPDGGEHKRVTAASEQNNNNDEKRDALGREKLSIIARTAAAAAADSCFGRRSVSRRTSGRLIAERLRVFSARLPFRRRRRRPGRERTRD